MEDGQYNELIYELQQRVDLGVMSMRDATFSLRSIIRKELENHLRQDCIEQDEITEAMLIAECRLKGIELPT